MPADHHVHWPDEVPARTRPSQSNLEREPSNDRPTWSAYRRPLSRLAQELDGAPRRARLTNGIHRRRQNRLTQENLDRVPIGGPLANHAYRRPEDRLTQENLDRVPLGGPLADNDYRRPQDRLTRDNLERVPVGGPLANNAFRRPEDRNTSENANHGSSINYQGREGYTSRNRPAARQTPRNPGRVWFMR
jgi:hypothetical protein